MYAHSRNVYGNYICAVAIHQIEYFNITWDRDKKRWNIYKDIRWLKSLTMEKGRRVFQQVNDVSPGAVTTLEFKFVEMIAWPSDDWQWNFQKRTAREKPGKGKR